MFTIIFFSLTQTVLGQKINGEISSLDYVTARPTVFQEIAITTIVKNTGEETATFKLQIIISKDGKIKKTFTHFLDLFAGGSSEKITLFRPEEIGTFDVIAKLWNEQEIKNFDTKVIQLDVISEIGPFDLFLDLLTRQVEPNGELPVVVTIDNKGQLKADVKIKVDIECFQTQKISEEFTILAEAKTKTQQKISMAVCPLQTEIGLHNIFAYIILNNKILAEAKSQFFINITDLRILFEGVPEILEAEQGQFLQVAITIANPSNSTLHNIRLLIEKIPEEWTQVDPQLINEIKPNETRVFILNFAIPEDAETGEYTMEVTAASEELLSKSSASLIVLPIVTAILPKDFLNYFYALVFVVAVILIIILKRRKKEVSRTGTEEILSKIKFGIR